MNRSDHFNPPARPLLAAGPELLAPAGDLDCVRAAIENGADAVYFGLDCGHNARHRARNFPADSLAELLSELHHRGLAGYLALNTLAFSEELEGLEAIVRLAAETGVDALIVQDLGLVRLIRAIAPDLPIHASTQMTLTSAEGIRVAKFLGVDRVILARELSLDEISRIASTTDVPLEVFVHGALCVAYSGQCLTSEALGGRSANRGQCAQACRLPYELVCDGNDVDLADMNYLLSPQDLAAYDLIPELVRIGVASVKIEGRLKTPEYVASVTRHYRRAIDAAVTALPPPLAPADVDEMRMTFSRGFSHGWLDGCDHKKLVRGKSPTRRGIELGTVAALRGRRVAVNLIAAIKPGDGVVFEGSGPADHEQGGRIFDIVADGKVVAKADAGMVELRFHNHDFVAHSIKPGQALWKTSDPELTRRLRQSFEVTTPRRRRQVDVRVVARVGSPLSIEATYAPGKSICIESEAVLEPAVRHPLTVETLREHLGRLGNTPYLLANIDATIEGGPMVPFRTFGTLRRQLVERLHGACRTPTERSSLPGSSLRQLRAQAKAVDTQKMAEPPQQPSLFVLCRTRSQVEAAAAANVAGIYVEFQEASAARRAIETAHKLGRPVFVAVPRIQKPGEAGLFVALARVDADGFLVRNLGSLAFCREQRIPFVADYSLNAANELAAAWLLEQGAVRFTASYDLNGDQLLALVDAATPGRMEVVIHQHMPMFHMEHCVFCAVLSPGTNKTNCGRPCDRHDVHLRDRIGAMHRLTADVGCRNTLFNATAQSAAEIVPTLVRRGVRTLRIELLDEDAEATRAIIDAYLELIAGRSTGRDTWKLLNASNRVGVTRGTLEERRNPLAII